MYNAGNNLWAERLDADRVRFLKLPPGDTRTPEAGVRYSNAEFDIIVTQAALESIMALPAPSQPQAAAQSKPAATTSLSANAGAGASAG